MQMQMAFPDFPYQPQRDQRSSALRILQFSTFLKSSHCQSLQPKSKLLHGQIQSSARYYTTQHVVGRNTEVLKPFHHRSQELTVEGGCLLWGIRVVIPRKLQARILEDLHRDHPGTSRMKSLARSHFWWPGLDKQIESHAKSCMPCQKNKHAPAVARLHPWVWPAKPWQRIHIDFAGPFQGRNFFIVVDAHSKWPEVFEMTSTTAAKTIGVLRHLFSSHGLPEQVVSDNGPQFISEEFSTVMKSNAIKHIRCAPYHPSSNGAAERFVQTFKQAMRATEKDGHSLSHCLANFLLTYHTTPHATTSVAPCTLFLQRQLRTRFHLLQPDCERKVNEKQAEQVASHDQHAKKRNLVVGQEVMARNLLPGTKWVPGVIIQQLGPKSNQVSRGDATLITFEYVMAPMHLNPPPHPLLLSLAIRTQMSSYQNLLAQRLRVPPRSRLRKKNQPAIPLRHHVIQVEFVIPLTDWFIVMFVFSWGGMWYTDSIFSSCLELYL